MSSKTTRKQIKALMGTTVSQQEGWKRGDKPKRKRKGKRTLKQRRKELGRQNKRGVTPIGASRAFRCARAWRRGSLTAAAAAEMARKAQNKNRKMQQNLNAMLVMADEPSEQEKQLLEEVGCGCARAGRARGLTRGAQLLSR